MERRHGEAVGDRPAADASSGRCPGRSAPNRSSISSRAAGQGRGSPSLAQSSSCDEARGLRRWRDRARPNSANLRTVRSGSSDQKAACSTSIGSAPSALRGAARMAPHRLQRCARPLPDKRAKFHGAASVTTRSHGDEVGGGDRHRPAEAIADQRRPARRARAATAAAAARRGRRRSRSDRLARFAPVEQQRRGGPCRRSPRPATLPDRGRGCAAG